MRTAPASADTRISRRTLRRGLRLMLAGCRRHPLAAALALTTGLVNGASMVFGAAALGWATEEFIVPSLASGRFPPALAAIAAAAVLAVSALRIVTIVLRAVGTGRIQFPNIAEDRRRLTRHYLALGPAWHERHPAGRLLSNVVSDTEARWQPMNLFPFAAGMVAMLGYAVVSIALADAWLSLVAIAVVPFLLGTNLVYQAAMVPRVRLSQQRRAAVSAFANEALEGDEVIRTLGLHERETGRFRERVELLRAANVRAGSASALFTPVIELAPSLGVVAVLAIGTVRADAGELTVGTLVEVAYLLLTMAIPLNVIGGFLGTLPLGVVGDERVRAVLEERLPDGGGRALPDGPVAIELRDATVHRGDRRILDGIDLGVRAGEVLAVSGATGSGKSTLLSLVAGLRPAGDGELRLSGIDSIHLDDASLRRSIAVVPQTSFLLHDTVRENLVLGRRGPDGHELRDAELWHALGIAAAEPVVRALPDGLDTVLGSRGATLSGGQRQRLAIARALLAQPSLLVLDDATSALDPGVERQVLAGLASHLRERRDAGSALTVVMAANRAPSLALADRLVLLEAGAVRAVGTFEELTADPHFQALVEAYERAAPQDPEWER
ncbi:ABC transporter ATP-binding protein [Microbacterium sp. 18062]|uniref:ABC transporter ATP-binding protein n=1 Tax=Microbacterium sp. 18062 TaxID=2681410 RepID=UPI0013583C91|nr:ABC transporter ATP-binding protein [Microbacterium sp. 18062]